MSFVSGIMMGAAIGRNIHDMMVGHSSMRRKAILPARTKVKAAQAGHEDELVLVSSMPGRRRYRMLLLQGNTPLAVLLERQLSRISCIQKVQANPVTGSLLVYYGGPEAVLEQVMEELGLRLVAGRCNASAAANGMMKPMAGQQTLYAKSWRSTGGFFNKQVSSMTSGWFDISTLMSLFFLVRGIRKMVMYGDRPNGPAMIWWALHLMKGWKG